MISGVVSADYEATVQLTVRSSQGQETTVETVVDTGFDGSLTLPPALVGTLGLPWRRRSRVTLADGSESLCDVYEGSIVWDGKLRRISIDAADTAPLIGMALLRGYELTVQVIEGGSVLIRALL